MDKIIGIMGNTTVTPYPRPDWNQINPTKADYIKNKPIKAAKVNGTLETDTSFEDILWQNHSWFNGVKDEVYDSQLNLWDFGMYIVEYWTGDGVSPQTLLLNQGDYYDDNGQEKIYQTVFDDKGEIYRRTTPYDELNWEGVAWKKVSSSGGDVNSEELDKRIKYINAWDCINEDGENIKINWYNNCDLFFKDIYISGIYSVDFSPDGVGGAYGILLVGGSESLDENYETYITTTQTFFREGEIVTRNTSVTREWSEWKPLYATTGELNASITKLSKELNKSITNVSNELDKRIKYINDSNYHNENGESGWDSASEFYFTDIDTSGIYSVSYSVDGITVTSGILIVGDEELQDDETGDSYWKTTQTFIRDNGTVTRSRGLSDEWSEWKSLYATNASVSQIRTSVNNLSKELDSRIKYAHGGEYDADPELFCADIVNSGVYHLRYSKDGITDNNGLLLVSEMADYSDSGIPKLIQTFYGEDICITRLGEFDCDDNGEYIVEKWYEWEDMFATNHRVERLEKTVGDFETALDTAIALCDSYINGGA